MSDRKQARVLLEAAERDLSALRGMGDADVFVDEIFGFHAQQAVEKSLKAWLAVLGEVYPLTHDLGELLTLLMTYDGDASRFEELIEYTPYAVRLRYAGVEPRGEPLDRDEVVRSVEALLEQVRRFMEDRR